jgi:hypothetical protein
MSMKQTRTSHRRALRFGVIAVAVAASAAGMSARSYAAGDHDPTITVTGACGSTQRIQFAPGTDHGTVSGTFCAGQDNRFVLRAGAGQTMTVSGIEPGTAFTVIAPDGTQLPGGPGETISYQLPATGDYTILHGPRRSEVTWFEFTVTIPPLGSGPACGTTQRIEFAPGTDHGTVGGAFCAGPDRRFVLWAGAGQTMTVSGIEPGTAFTVIAPDGTELPGGPGETISYQLPATGDYTILHGPRRSEVTSFEFTVTIPPLGGAPAPTRVQFPAGSFGTSFRDSVAGDSVDRFLLWAGAGHRMVVHVDAAADNATITIVAPDGTVLTSGQTQPVIDSLPATGDYLVEVHPSGGSATYQIGFWIR